MTTGIILAVFVLFLCSSIILRKVKNSRVKKGMRMAHRIVGYVFLVTVVLHMILTLPLMKQRPIFMYVLGFTMLAAGVVSVLSYVLRKKWGKSWIKWHRGMAAIIILCMVGHLILGITSLNQYKKEVADIQIDEVKLQDVEDGSYVGECNVGYIYARVQVEVKNHKLVQVVLLEHRTERGKPAEKIVEQMESRQNNKVDAVSSATNSSKVIMKAAENALQNGKAE